MALVRRSSSGIIAIVTFLLAACEPEGDAAATAQNAPVVAADSSGAGRFQVALPVIVSCPLADGEEYHWHRHWFRNFRNPQNIAIWAGGSRLLVKSGVMPGTGLLDYEVSQSSHNRAMVEFGINSDAPATNPPSAGGGRYVLRIHYGPCRANPDAIVRVDDGARFEFTKRSPGHWIEAEVDDLSTYAAAAPGRLLPESIPPDTVSDVYMNADTTSGQRLEPPR
jgi:hypothetical protein